MPFIALKHKFHQPNRNWAILLGLSVVLAFTPLAFVSLGLLLFAGARVLRLRFGLWTGLALSFMALTGVVSMIAALAWIVHAPLSSAFILITAAAVVFGLLCTSSTQPAVLPDKKELLNSDDLTSLAVALACMILVCLPLLPRPSASNIIPLVMYGGDNSAHLDIFRTLDRNQGFAIGHNNRANLGSILVAYPQGWHFMGVFVKWTLQGVAPIGASPTSTLLFFYSMATLWFGMMVLLITRLSLLVVHHTTKPKVKKSVAIFSKVIVALSCFIGINGFLLSLFAFGFQTQIAALGFLLAEVVALVAAYSTKDLRQRLGYILLATLLMAASGFSWLFLYPVSGLILFCAVVHTIARYKKLPLYFVVGLIILGAGVLFQPFIQLSVPVPAYQDGVNVINQRGNVVATDMLLIGLLALAAATWAYVYFREATVRILIASLGVAIAFSLVLMWYQLGTIHELRYYYYKSTYTGIMLVIVLLSALVGWAATTLLQSNAPLKKLSIVQKMLVGAGLLGILALSATLIKSPTYDGFIHKSLAGISPAQAGTVVDIAAKQPENGWRVVSIGSCNRGDDIRTTLLADSLSLVPPRGTKSPGHFIRLDKLEKQTLFAGIDKFISQDDGTPSLIILSNDQVIGAELMSALSPAHQSRIQLINLDPSIETEPALQCPERVR